MAHNLHLPRNGQSFGSDTIIIEGRNAEFITDTFGGVGHKRFPRFKLASLYEEITNGKVLRLKMKLIIWRFLPSGKLNFYSEFRAPGVSEGSMYTLKTLLEGEAISSYEQRTGLKFNQSYKENSTKSASRNGYGNPLVASPQNETTGPDYLYSHGEHDNNVAMATIYAQKSAGGDFIYPTNFSDMVEMGTWNAEFNSTGIFEQGVSYILIARDQNDQEGQGSFSVVSPV